MDEWVIEPFDRTSHDRADFSCGIGSLDTFLHSLISQYEKRRLGRTYVIVRAGSRAVVGYFTLAAGSIPPEIVPAATGKKLPSYPVPVVLLARLAVDRWEQGRGLGGRLLAFAVQKCLELAKSIGIHSVTVGVIDESARAFYERFGFLRLLDAPHHLHLPMASIESGRPSRADSPS